jgi:TolB-like protein/DNA-binding winged helix-turn-helix (wHTH) protein/Flp pilus assembly protein TadD
MLYRFDDCELDDRLYQLRRKGERVEIEPKAFDLLVYLLHQCEQVVTKEELLDKLWPGTVVSEAALTRCIARAREAIGDNGDQQRIIKTQHGRGYRFVAPLISSPLPSPESSVQSQEDVASSQYSVVSREEERQEAKDKTAEVPLPSSSFSLQPEAFGLPQSSEGRAGFARHKGVMVAVVGLLLLAGAIGIVRYFSLPLITHHSSLITEEAQPLSLPLPDKPSIIVLPFQNLSSDPGQDYFGDGFTEILTGDLSRISSLFVIARNSAFTYKGKAVKVQDVSREMGVRYVLEGSVLKADNQVRITAQLIDATTGYHLWSERYDRPLQNILTLQDEIVQKIVTTLKLQLTLREQGYRVRKHTDNLEAYDNVLRGVGYFVRYTKEANAQARQMYEKAIALDPQYAEAYVGLGQTYVIEWVWHWSADPQTLERAGALAHQSLALDDSLPKAHLLLSRVYALQQQYEQALAEVERSIVLDPNNAESYAYRSDALAYAGRPEEALQAIEQAIRLDPHYPPWYLLVSGFAYRMTGRYAEAIAALKEAISRSPNLLPAHLNLAGSYLIQWGSQQSSTAQTLELAMAAAQRGLALNASLDWSRIQLGYVYLSQQQYEQALAEMERGMALGPSEAMSRAALAMVLGCMGRTEDALETATQALRLKPIIADGHLGDVGGAYMLAGRYEEAQAALQRFLSRYPNMLLAHLGLAVVYSELGQAAEARAEVAEVLRLNPNFSLEIHKQRAPIKDPVVLERHIAALRKAGLK